MAYAKTSLAFPANTIMIVNFYPDKRIEQPRTTLIWIFCETMDFLEYSDISADVKGTQVCIASIGEARRILICLQFPDKGPPQND